jgi:predicted dehydrogenase
LGVLLVYDTATELPREVRLAAPAESPDPAPIRLGMLGAGNFATGTLLPAVRANRDITLTGIVSASGLSARSSAGRFGFAYCASDESALLQDPGTNWIAILTRHDLHAGQAIAAMEAGKDVFVEKPLALNRAELLAVVDAQSRTRRRLMVGFNRRFAPMVEEMRGFLAGRQRPLVALYRVNAGAIAASHWTQDPAIGGGRIIGEVCHFIDLLQLLAGSSPSRVYTQAAVAGGKPIEDEVVISISFADGSVATVIYTAGGDRSFGKERIEAYSDGKVAVLDDFRSLELVGSGRRTRRRERLRPEKGHRGQWRKLVEAASAGAPTPITMTELVAAHLAAYAAVESLQTGRPVDIDSAAFLGTTPVPNP